MNNEKTREEQINEALKTLEKSETGMSAKDFHQMIREKKE